MKDHLSATEKQQLDTLRSALARNLDSRAKFELLAFWARHPSGWSSRGAVAPRSFLNHEERNAALRELVDAGVVDVRGGSGFWFYGLAAQHPAYAAVLQLGRLTPKMRKYLMRAARSEPSQLAEELAS